ncbi:MAG: hypothetical protein WCY11_05135 [Novosphingobium sp.]
MTDTDVKIYGSRIGTPAVVLTEPMTERESKILRRLEKLSGDGRGDFGMIPRRHLKASVDTMQVLYLKGLVDGRGLRDTHGYGNTPDSSIWGITERGLKAIGAAHD